MKSPLPSSSDNVSQHSLSDSNAIIQALGGGKNKRARKLLARMHPGKIAALLERLDTEQRLTLWQQIGPELEERTLHHLSPSLRAQLAGDSAEASLAASDEPGNSQLEAVRQALAQGKLKRLGKLLHRMHPAKVAGLLEAMPPAERNRAWSMVETEQRGQSAHLSA